MKRFSRPSFLEELKRKGVGIDPRHPETHELGFMGRRDFELSWALDNDTTEFLPLLAAIVAALSTGTSRFVFRRECEDILEFQPAEDQGLVSVLYGYTLFCPALSEPLYAIPSDASCLVVLTRRREVDAHFSTSAQMERFRKAMTEKGFPERTGTSVSSTGAGGTPSKGTNLTIAN